MSPPSHAIRALLVDGVGDAELVLRSFARGLHTSCEVDHVELLEDAVVALASKAYDVALIDPGPEGAAAIERLRESAGLAAIVALSARDDDALRREAVAAGADDFLVKGWVVGSSTGPRLLERSLAFAIERRRQRAEIERLNESFRRLAQIDPLTGLPNRRGLEIALEAASSRALRSGASVAAVLVDCDDFKFVNERYGHAAGDVVLSEVAQRLDRSVRPSDTVARVGGDEFIVLLPESSVHEALEVAERSRLAVSGTKVSLGDDQEITMSASFGVSSVDLQAPSIEGVLKCARAALAASKRAGKNRVQAASPQRDASLERALSLLDELTASPMPLGVAFQPIVRLSDGAVVAHEFFHHPAAGSGVSAAALSQAAAESDRLALFDQICLETYLDAARSFHHGAGVHLDIHPHTLLEPGVAAYIAAKLDGLRPRREVCLELDAATLMPVLRDAKPAIRRLRQAHITVAIDGLRLGAGTLDDLLEIGADVVKLAPQSVTGCGSDPAIRRSLETLARISTGAGAELIALGVESLADLDACREVGILHGQGSLLGQPLELAGFVRQADPPDLRYLESLPPSRLRPFAGRSPRARPVLVREAS